MIPVTTFAGETVAVFGLGGSGLASCRALMAGGARVIAWDDNAGGVAAAQAAGIPTQDLRQADWGSVAALVLAPGVPLTHPKPHWTVELADEHDVEVIGDIELFCRERRANGIDAPLVAITGTNGKSTTTALTAHLLRSAGLDVQMGGNIGTAVLSLEPPQEGRVYVIECSSYQIDLAPSLDATVGILLNVTEDHLDRHGTIEHYAAVKERLIARAQIAVIAVEDDFTRAAAERREETGAETIRVSASEFVSPGVFMDGTTIVAYDGEQAAPIADLDGIGALRGTHNAQNAVAAAAAVLALGVEPETIRTGLASFPGLAHRMEQLGHVGHALFVNDSKATNADSAAKALACFEDIFWILGGQPKTGGIESLRGFFPRVRKAYLIGVAAEEFVRTLDGVVPYEMCGTLDCAVAAAARDAAASPAALPVVLLSPACASFDQYRNFEIRGEAFRAAVAALPGFRPVAAA
ncbi:MAG TPA: UDP-N-acetylmuramoyl-L-alanine--D-glutamate ligase [Xanthobacteraceae bacterium]|nr:UDP-N-acetylmuramoyl-L-alanine--D-glutamate ligase [Xanthobacteraceae bacterium]